MSTHDDEIPNPKLTPTLRLTRHRQKLIAAGYGLDGFKPDMGDVVGSAVCLIGVLIVMLWPRDGGGLEADGDAPIAKSLRRLAAA